MINALEGLVIESPARLVTLGRNHHVTMNMFLAKTEGGAIVTVGALGEMATTTEAGCK
jgi:urea transport system substrate-binding protein